MISAKSDWRRLFQERLLTSEASVHFRAVLTLETNQLLERRQVLIDAESELKTVAKEKEMISAKSDWRRLFQERLLTSEASVHFRAVLTLETNQLLERRQVLIDAERYLLAMKRAKIVSVFFT
ncbi:hypothetical protein TNIN_213741 [Trichonephila inaurata madagascariensis]|uniref:Uncharacterized protein n=1 Tax=Trichonephila inaurata madagascariensis TaxID=2747483 RepID=A0A8X6XDY6_9ARAC|nr:hypothetical protein TNIN_213741 [Trichonephila inaurata madagascariensis]